MPTRVPRSSKTGKPLRLQRNIRFAASKIGVSGLTVITSLVMTWKARMLASLQCDISVGTVIVLSISRVTPPRMPSCRRECP